MTVKSEQGEAAPIEGGGADVVKSEAGVTAGGDVAAAGASAAASAEGVEEVEEVEEDTCSESDPEVDPQTLLPLPGTAAYAGRIPKTTRTFYAPESDEDDDFDFEGEWSLRLLLVGRAERVCVVVVAKM